MGEVENGLLAQLSHQGPGFNYNKEHICRGGQCINNNNNGTGGFQCEVPLNKGACLEVEAVISNAHRVSRSATYHQPTSVLGQEKRLQLSGNEE